MQRFWLSCWAPFSLYMIVLTGLLILNTRFCFVWIFSVFVLSLINLVVYAWDKYAARKQYRRIPEKHLYLLAFLGGWPGAVVAQQWLRHKTFKPAFRKRFWLAVVGNCAVFLMLLYYWR